MQTTTLKKDLWLQLKTTASMKKFAAENGIVPDGDKRVPLIWMIAIDEWCETQPETIALTVDAAK